MEESIIRCTPPGENPNRMMCKHLFRSGFSSERLGHQVQCPLATRTIIRAPMDNGWGPVSFYLTVFLVQSRPPKSIHRLPHAPFPSSGTLCRSASVCYYSSSQVSLFDVVCIICTFFWFVNSFLKICFITQTSRNRNLPVSLSLGFYKILGNSSAKSRWIKQLCLTA